MNNNCDQMFTQVILLQSGWAWANPQCVCMHLLHPQVFCWSTLPFSWLPDWTWRKGSRKSGQGWEDAFQGTQGSCCRLCPITLLSHGLPVRWFNFFVTQLFNISLQTHIVNLPIGLNSPMRAKDAVRVKGIEWKVPLKSRWKSGVSIKAQHNLMKICNDKESDMLNSSLH